MRDKNQESKRREKTQVRQGFLNKSQKFPNLYDLKDLLSIPAIRNHPKLALLAHEVLAPYVEIFNNQIISFPEKCV